jgi:hypothetical protein
VDLIARRFRGVVIALVVLGLSASVAFAGHLTFAPTAQPTATEQGDQGEQADENDNDSPEADDNDNDSESSDEDAGEAGGDNHGKLVSTAALMDTPTGFKNHGAFVSCVAHMKTAPTLEAGQTLEAFLAALTPEQCTTADEQSDEDATEDTTDPTAEVKNHGALVSAAAQMADPEGFANHGEFVSCVARMKDVPTGMSVDEILATVTVDVCRGTAEQSAKADKADKAHGKGGKHGKGHRNRS